MGIHKFRGNMQPLFFLALILFSISSCAPSRLVRPLQKGESAIGGNLGGPLIGFGASTIPVPFTSIYYAKGIQDDLSAFVGLHTTAMAAGVVQVDLGILKGWGTPEAWRPGFSIAPTANLMYDVWDNNFRFYPQVDLNAYWNTSSRRDHFMHIGLTNWFDFHKGAVTNKDQHNYWLPAINLGHTFVTSRWNFGIELKYLGPTLSNEAIVIDYGVPGDKGALGVYLKAAYRFGLSSSAQN